MDGWMDGWILRFVYSLNQQNNLSDCSFLRDSDLSGYMFQAVQKAL
jgi:hypothetical protein